MKEFIKVEWMTYLRIYFKHIISFTIINFTHLKIYFTKTEFYNSLIRILYTLLRVQVKNRKEKLIHSLWKQTKYMLKFLELVPLKNMNFIATNKKKEYSKLFIFLITTIWKLSVFNRKVVMSYFKNLKFKIQSKWIRVI